MYFVTKRNGKYVPVPGNVTDNVTIVDGYYVHRYIFTPDDGGKPVILTKNEYNHKTADSADDLARRCLVMNAVEFCGYDVHDAISPRKLDKCINTYLRENNNN